MSARRKITLARLAGSMAYAPIPDGYTMSMGYVDATAYHHDDVVRELVEALKAADQRLTFSESTFSDQGCYSRAKACRDVLYKIDAALAKIAQEG